MVYPLSVSYLKDRENKNLYLNNKLSPIKGKLSVAAACKVIEHSLLKDDRETKKADDQ